MAPLRDRACVSRRSVWVGEHGERVVKTDLEFCDRGLQTDSKAGKVQFNCSGN